MDEPRIKQIMGDILRIHPEQIDGRTSMKRLDSWDSLSHIELIGALEQEFEITLDVDDIERMVSFVEIQNVLQLKGSSP